MLEWPGAFLGASSGASQRGDHEPLQRASTDREADAKQDLHPGGRRERDRNQSHEDEGADHRGRADETPQGVADLIVEVVST